MINYLASAELAVGVSAAELAVSDKDFCLTSSCWCRGEIVTHWSSVVWSGGDPGDHSLKTEIIK